MPKKRQNYDKRNIVKSNNISTSNQEKHVYNKRKIQVVEKPKNKQNINQYSEQINTLKSMQSLAQVNNNPKPRYINNKNQSVFNKTLHNNLIGSLNKKASYSNGTIGLTNLGNICYFNSAIQNLKNVYLLTENLLSSYSDFNMDGFAFKYCKLLSNLINQDKYQYTEPRELFFKLSEIAPIFRFGEQNDSNFCIIYILNLLEKETRKHYPKQKMFKEIKTYGYFSKKEEEIFNKYQKKLYEKRNSPIIEYFYGFQEDIYKCINCKYNGISFQGISVLNLSIMKNNYNKIKSIEEAISYYQEEQNHFIEKDFICPNCSSNGIITQSKIISLPKVLIINFKRIGEKHFYNHNVQVPNILVMENLIMNQNYSNYKYELIGFIKHIGGANSGHNIAICKNFFDNIWYIYDDSRVLSLNNSRYISNCDIDKTNGFLFFYKRIGEDITEETKNLIIEKSAELRK